MNLESRQWIDPSLDGVGGGYGKFKGLTIDEIASLFTQLSETPAKRNVSGILRIAYEQLEIRSHLAISTQSSIVLGTITLLLAGAVPFVAVNIRLGLTRADAICGVLFLGFLGGAIGSRRQAKSAAAQERAIAAISVEVLGELISSPDFKSFPLDTVQEMTLKKVLKLAKSDKPELRALLS